MEFLFLLIGLGFFVWIIDYVQKSNREERNHQDATDRENYARKLNEQREFGYQPISRDPPTEESKHKK